ncbi:GATOR complex protein NPRL3-like [Lingula anatina]|uniref:GATOR complex protein NPRL3 n=1 Tax=Lingula anatina TaxID=7574 RepID=A0A1S3KC02_LINAN|nr:GATOR complex protein NPRL3-like [Lingula anatina]|eukprot:XP_013420163.1 GATOR complex protein NPRL3-like [Lingula anatina]
MWDFDPVGIFLVTSGSRGDQLLFRYPFEADGGVGLKGKSAFHTNPYAIRIAEDPKPRNSPQPCIKNGVLVGYSNELLAYLLAVKSDLCGQKFDLTIDDVRFVGYPVLLQRISQSTPRRELPTMISFHVVIAVRAQVKNSVVAAYHELTQKLALSFHHEEQRCGYLNTQKNLMQGIQEEVTTLPEDSYENPFKLMVAKGSKCELSKDLKAVYDNLGNSGIVSLYVNKWIYVSFCLPHKVHNILQPELKIEPEAIQKCIEALRPYHGLLLMVPERQLLESLPPDCSPAMVRFIKAVSPLKRLQTLAADADLPLGQVFHLSSHLVYWAIMGLPQQLVGLGGRTQGYHGASATIGRFSALWLFYADKVMVLLHVTFQAQQVQMVVWMLQRRLLTQLHTYVFLVLTSSEKNQTIYYRTHSTSVSEDMPFISDTGSVVSGTSDGSPRTSSFAKSPSENAREEILRRLPQSLHMNSVNREAICAVPAANNLEDLKMFVRLCPYFNGQFHLEEIMYHENLRRSQLLTLIDKFRSILVTCTHPDPATSFHGK